MATVNQRGEALLQMIGNTPLIPLEFSPEDRTIWVKCEFLNPSGSIKDRLARTIIRDARQRDLLQPDSIILECTSGNTGIAFAMIGAACGYGVSIARSKSAWLDRRQPENGLAGKQKRTLTANFGRSIAQGLHQLPTNR